MNQENFVKIKEIIEEKLKISEDENAIVLMSKNMPSNFQLVLDIFINELKLFKKMQKDKEKKYSELYKEYKEKYNLSLTKDEIKTYCNSNEEYYKICVDLDNQEVIVKYFEMTLDNIKRMSYDIKNWIEIKKFYAGC